MIVYRVTFMGVTAHYSTIAEARKEARTFKLIQLRDRTPRKDIVHPVIEEIFMMPLDKMLVVDILNGKDPIINVRVVNARKGVG